MQMSTAPYSVENNSKEESVHIRNKFFFLNMSYLNHFNEKTEELACMAAQLYVFGPVQRLE